MMSHVHEVNCDGLVGPTHNYAGLSVGNLASLASRRQQSHPREAALQGLTKMRLLDELGVRQIVLPPHVRPDLGMLRRAGFAGGDVQVIERAAATAPDLLAAAYSASSMWAANSATVCPSVDTTDGLVHFVPANMVSEPHRAIEAGQTAVILKRIFHDPSCFAHECPLPASILFRDEGAANHSRLCGDYGRRGVHLFVHGESAFHPDPLRSRVHPARQTIEASHAVARLCRIPDDRALFARQHPDAIDAGVFHNDVASVADRNLLLIHERAWVNQRCVIDEIRRVLGQCCEAQLRVVEVPEAMLSLAQAVSSYLFNSQIVRAGDGTTVMICPEQCERMERARAVVDMVMAQGGIDAVHYVNLDQSMSNGGGPACLRLRVVLNDAELAAVHPSVIFTPALADKLETWINTHHRESLDPDDLRDPRLIDESCRSVDELSRLLDLPDLYA